MVSSVTNLGANASRRYIEINSGKANKATEELASGLVASNPSYDPSSSAVGYRLTANIESLQQASRNVGQATSMIQMATGFLGATNDVLTRMKRITVAANTDTIGDSERKMLDAEFQTLVDQVDKNATNARWGGVSLFTGGSGTVSNHPTVANATVAGGSTAATNYFAANTGFVAASSTGLFNGSATDATVTKTGSNFNISVTIGNQTFNGTTTGATGTVLLTSTTDAGNRVAFSIGTSATAATAAQMQTDLKTALGIDSTTLAPATFNSVNTATGGMPNLSFTPGAGTKAGVWALSYTINGTTDGTFKLTRGSEYYTATIDQAGTIASGTVSFDNGVVLSLSSFVSTASVAQYLYDVGQGTEIVQSFQYAEKSTDTLSVTFKGASVATLGLTNANVVTKTDAAAASAAIDLAQQAINEQIGALGGKASQFKFMSDTLRVNIQNSQAARATFTDSDVAQSMQDLQTYNGLQQIAQSVFSKALSDLTSLVQMVQSAR